jgi:peptidoglycan/xylan/chitin deacetylase (PgdA/CDA1 family)
LNTLKTSHLKSTIFLSRDFIDKYPELTQRISKEQEVGNRISTTVVTREELQDELRRTEEGYYLTTGKRMARFWRSDVEPDPQLRRWAAELGYMHVAWTSNPGNRQSMNSFDSVSDQTHENFFPGQLMKDRIISFGQNESEQANGAIILLHLGSERKTQDRIDPWLSEIIKTFKQRGYRFITVSELINRQNLHPNFAAAQ